MKIGILTTHYPYNYGAVLQAFALQEHLKSLGHTVSIINYHSEYLYQKFSVFNIDRFSECKNIFSLVKSLIYYCLIIPKRYIRLRSFNVFSKSKFNLTKVVKADSIPSDFDRYILGSDQIWNHKMLGGYDKVYFGDFPVKSGSKIISYAASMPVEQFTVEQKDFFISRLRKIDTISVREAALQALLQPLTNKNIHTVLDPTLLSNKSIWDILLENKPPRKRKYVLLYQVRYSAESVKISGDISRQLDADVIELTGNIHDWRLKKNKRQCAGPREFVNLVKYAECIVSTSFHGTAFAIIFNKPFYSLRLNDGRDSRAANLLESLGLCDRFITEDTRPVFSKIDYTTANSKLERLQASSALYLQNAIGG
jgi:hypothetical protein